MRETVGAPRGRLGPTRHGRDLGEGHGVGDALCRDEGFKALAPDDLIADTSPGTAMTVFAPALANRLGRRYLGARGPRVRVARQIVTARALLPPGFAGRGVWGGRGGQARWAVAAARSTAHLDCDGPPLTVMWRDVARLRPSMRALGTVAVEGCSADRACAVDRGGAHPEGGEETSAAWLRRGRHVLARLDTALPAPWARCSRRTRPSPSVRRTTSLTTSTRSGRPTGSAPADGRAGSAPCGGADHRATRNAEAGVRAHRAGGYPRREEPG